MLLDLLLTDLKCFSLSFLILLHSTPVLVRRKTDHGLQRLYHLFILDLLGTGDYPSILHTPGSLNNHMASLLDLKLSRRKEINLPRLPEAHANHLCHTFYSP